MKTAYPHGQAEIQIIKVYIMCKIGFSTLRPIRLQCLEAQRRVVYSVREPRWHTSNSILCGITR